MVCTIGQYIFNFCYVTCVLLVKVKYFSFVALDIGLMLEKIGNKCMKQLFIPLLYQNIFLQISGKSLHSWQVNRDEHNKDYN